MSFCGVRSIVDFGSNCSRTEIAVYQILTHIVTRFGHSATATACTFVVSFTRDSFTLVAKTVRRARFSQIWMNRVRNVFTVMLTGKLLTAISAKTLFCRHSFWRQSLMICLLFLSFLCMFVRFAISLRLLTI